MSEHSSSDDFDIKLKPRSSPPSGGDDGGSYADSTGQAFDRVSGAWLERAYVEDLGTAAFEDTGAFAAAVHTHVAADTTDFGEAVDDRVALSLLQDAGGVSWSYDDINNTLSPSVSHGGINGLLDDDHTQYHNDARALTWLGTLAASQAEMEAGTEAGLRSMSPLRVAQAIAALASVSSLPKSYIAGLTCSNGTDADHDIDIAVGECRAADDSADLVLAAVLTKQADAAWAVGDDAGGMDAGSVAADTLYAVWLIRRSDTGVIDALFSTSFSAPTMPANYDSKRLIWAVMTDASANILPFEQYGDWCHYVTQAIIEVSDATITDDTFETATLGCVPPNAVAILNVHMRNDGNNIAGHVMLENTVSGGKTANVTSFGQHAVAIRRAAVTNNDTGASVLFPVDASQQLNYAANEVSGTSTVTIGVEGFCMTTRRDP